MTSTRLPGPPYRSRNSVMFAGRGLGCSWIATDITNVNVFDGKSDKLAMGVNVSVKGNLILQVGKDFKADGALVVDDKCQTITPGLIDTHQHLLPGGPDRLISSGGIIEFATVGAIRCQTQPLAL